MLNEEVKNSRQYEVTVTYPVKITYKVDRNAVTMDEKWPETSNLSFELRHKDFKRTYSVKSMPQWVKNKVNGILEG